MLEELRSTVCKANKDLLRHGLVLFTWGNVSQIDRETGLVVIKPSGVSYDEMTPEDMVIVNLEGRVVEGALRPSSDTPTHLALYRSFPEIGGIVHTHSTHATAWAQAGREIPVLGTTHADEFHGSVPCTREMRREEIFGAYEEETGNVIAECFKGRNPMDTPAVLVRNHGPFTWGKDAEKAVYNAAALEEVARMAFITLMLNPESSIKEDLIEKHHARKHGPGATYGQK